MAARKKQIANPELKGWKEIAAFLGQPVSLVQKWHKTEELPVQKSGRYVTTTREALNAWLGKGVHVPQKNEELTTQLKAALKKVRNAA